MGTPSVLGTLQQLAPTLKVSNGTATATAKNMDIIAMLTLLFPELSTEMALLPDIDLTTIKIVYTQSSDTGSVSANYGIDSDKITGTLNLNVAKNKSNVVEYVTLLGYPKSIDLGENLPLVGSHLKGKFAFNEAYLCITSATMDTVKSTAKKKPKTIPKGIAFVFDMTVAGKKKDVTVPVYKYKAQSKAEKPKTESNPDGKVNVQEEVGPIDVSSYTVTYASGKLSCDISATLALGPIKVDLEDLSMSVSFSDLSSPSFGLDGLSFDYNQPPLKIEGGIDHVKPPTADNAKIQYDGDLAIQAETFGLSALASYVQTNDGSTSFFIFADVRGILGGPPFFLVTGLMGGFGYNRSLKMPTFDKVSKFPLLPPLTPKKQKPPKLSKKADDVKSSLEKGGWIPVKEGDYWLAAGINFTSFEVITGQLLLVAEFGNDLKFAILGNAGLALPQGKGEKFVNVELQIEVELEPNLGYFSAGASLTKNSYVLTKDCHLTGGFAFDLWFGDNPNAGQFVMTAGGYNPAFTAPSYFPQVDRLGFNWKVSSDISITGGAYFAMTPSCGMAGGSLNVLFQAGPVKAWFDAAANFLVTWHPFHFNGNISISIGASVKVDLLVCHTTVSVSLGASLDIWGSPLGGKVKVHIVVVTVTISFGSDDATTPSQFGPLKWSDDIVGKLLPKEEDLCKIVANTGLTSKQDDGTWIVRSGSFGFSTQSSIPSSAMYYDGPSGKTNTESGDDVNVRPMFESSVASTHSISITKEGASEPVDVEADNWTLTANRGDVPETLWGAPITVPGFPGIHTQNPARPSAKVVANQMVGYNVTAPDPTYTSTPGAMEMVQFAEADIEGSQQPMNPLNQSVTDNSDFTTQSSDSVISDIGGISGSGVATARTNIFDILNSAALYTGSNDSMSTLASEAGSQFSQAPLEQAS